MRKSIEAHVKGSFESSSQKKYVGLFSQETVCFMLRSSQFQQRAKKYGSKEVGGLNLFIFFNW